MENFGDKKCAGWLEECVRTLFEEKAEHIAVCAILPDGDLFTGFFQCDVRDKGVIASGIQADAMWDTVMANIGQIRDALEEDEEDKEEGEDEE